MSESDKDHWIGKEDPEALISALASKTGHIPSEPELLMHKIKRSVRVITGASSHSNILWLLGL